VEQSYRTRIEQELQTFPAVVLDEFRRVIPLVERKLSDEDCYAWAKEGMAVAQSGFRAWEATAEYFAATPQALEILTFPQIVDWARCGRMLAAASAGLSAAYFRESPTVVKSLTISQLQEWAKLGKSLYKGSWWSTSLASRFFEVSPSLLRCLGMDDLVRFTGFIECLSNNRHEFAGDCLGLAAEVLSKIEKQDCPTFLQLGLIFAKTNWNNAKTYFSAGPEILSRIDQGERGRFLSLAGRISHQACEQALPFLMDGSQALRKVPPSLHHRLLTLAEELLELSCLVAIEFLKSSPTVLSKIKLPGLEGWFREGVSTLRKSEEGGIAYFRIELNKSLQVLEQLSSGIELSGIKELLYMYCHALSGKKIPIQSADNARRIGIGWATSSKPWTEGEAILLPELVDKHPTKEKNFIWYKVMATHQAGHLEFGSFSFRFDRDARLFTNLRPQIDEQRNKGGALTDLERFFNLFDDRTLATDILTIVEDGRIDYLVNREYRGIRKDYRNVQEDALSTRPPLYLLPLKGIFLEILIQISLGKSGEILVPAEIRTYLTKASLILKTVLTPEATVEDCAEVTIRLYQIISEIPNKMADSGDWEMINLSEGLDELSLPVGNTVASSNTLSGEGGVPYTSPKEVEFRGDFKPELVQLLVKLKAEHRQDNAGLTSSLSPEALKQLLENVGIELSDLITGELPSQQGLFVTDLKKEANQPFAPQPASQQRNKSGDTSHGDSLENDFASFLYDEWDFRASDYKPRWCRVKQRTLQGGTPDFFETTLANYAGLVGQIKRQFEQMNPQALRKVKRLQDGEDFDLDAVVDSVVERKAGRSPSEKIYWRRNKAERDVSVVFLLDISASTSEYIDEGHKGPSGSIVFRDYREYLDWLQPQRVQSDKKTFKRIIDLEKEGTVLLMKALETIGDTYAIYGFSGFGRENVEFYVIKDLEEGFSDKIKGRLDTISPMHATRMGPAIRHATWKLEQQPHKGKFLFLISDGRPQDHGYGRDGLDKEYAINDTRKALLEAKWKNITPFCLTVDHVGQDYLKTMCADMGYEVLASVESLPERLPALYRKLTV
jgi:hypothetical protein